MVVKDHSLDQVELDVSLLHLLDTLVNRCVLLVLSHNLLILLECLHVLKQGHTLKILEDLLAFLGSLDQCLHRKRMLLANLNKQVRLHSEHLNRLVGIGVVEIGVLIWLIEENANLTEVRAIGQDTILIQALLVHDVDLSAD